MEDIRYRVWFEGDAAPSSRYFFDRADACSWAFDSQPNLPLELCEERPGAARRFLTRLRK